MPTPAEQFRNKSGPSPAGRRELPFVGGGSGLQTQGPQAPKQARGPLADFGVVPEEARKSIREGVEGLPTIPQMGAEIGPAMGGAALGGAIGAFGGPLAPVTVPLGMMIGGALFEAGAQELGLAPESDLNLVLSGTGPIGGLLMGGILKGMRRGVGAAISSIPPAQVAAAKTAAKKAAAEMQSLGAIILGKQKGLITRSSNDLYEAAKRVTTPVNIGRLGATTDAVLSLRKELQSVAAFPEAKQALRLLGHIEESFTANRGNISFETLVETRTMVGRIIDRVEKTGGVKLGTGKKVFKALNEDLDRLAKSPVKGRRGAQIMQAAAKRAKLEFAVRDLEQGVAKFVTDTSEGSITVNMKGLQKWFRALTDPKSKTYSKNFVDALDGEASVIRKRLAELAKTTKGAQGSSGGPGSLVIRGVFAGAGGGIGLNVAGAPGAALGAMIGAGAPERITAILTSKSGAALLTRAAKLGRGDIRQNVWAMLGQITAREAGGESGQQPAGSTLGAIR